MTIETIRLAGTPAERGEHLGRARADAVARWLTGWLGSIARCGIAKPKSHVARMLGGTAYLQAIQVHAPDLLEQVEGIARGAALPAELILAGQLMDEEWEYRRTELGQPRPGKCTSFAIRDGGVTWIGQNMDLDPFTHGHQLVMELDAFSGQPAARIFTVGGMVGLMGANAAGVAVCVNALPDLPGRPDGVPVAFVIRKLLQHRSAKGAIAWLAQIPHATPQHYLIADSSAIRSIEVTPSGLNASAAVDADLVLHTNHPLAIDTPPVSPRYRSNSVARLQALTGHLVGGAVTVERLIAALASRDDPANPICRWIGDDTPPRTATTSFTTGAMICQLSERAFPRTWFSAGPPSDQSFTAFEL
nr:C45 family peptidase [Sphingomonas sp. Y57]